MIEIGLILVLIVLNGLLAGSEAGFVAARKARLREQADAGFPGAKAALRASESPTSFLSTVQVGITLISICSGFFGAEMLAPDVMVMLEPVFESEKVRGAVAKASVVVVITYFSLVIGELVPKRLALEHPELVARKSVGPMLFLATVCSPAVKFLAFSTNLLLKPTGVGASRDEKVSEEEVRSMIRQGGSSGVLEREEISVIERVFVAADRRVGSFMEPRREVECLDPDAGPDEVGRMVRDSRGAYLPVSPGGLDELLGVVSVIELGHAENASIRDLVRAPLFVPEAANALRAIELFRRHNAQIAFVTDEHGTIEGLVRLADLLEEILGEDGNGEDSDDPSITMREDGSLLIDGMVPVDDLLEHFGERPGPEFDPSTYHTVGGLVVHHLGHVPKVGERIAIGAWRFEVVEMDGRRIDKVRAAREPDAADDAPD